MINSSVISQLKKDIKSYKNKAKTDKQTIFNLLQVKVTEKKTG